MSRSKVSIIITVTMMLVVFDFLLAENYRYYDQTFMSKSVTISDLEIDQHYARWQGGWRNIRFKETTHLHIKIEDKKDQFWEIPSPWEGIGNTKSNFFLIAELEDTSIYIECPYGSENEASAGFNRWQIVEEENDNYQLHPSGLYIQTNLLHFYTDDLSFMSYDTAWFVKTIVEERPVYTFQYYTRGVHRSMLWEAEVPEGEDLTLHFGTDFIETGFDSVYGEGKINKGLRFGKWKDYMEDPKGAVKSAWTEWDSVFVPKYFQDGEGPPLPFPGKLVFKKYLSLNPDSLYIPGENWLPDLKTSNGDFIGMIFESQDTIGNLSSSIITYDIFNITSWDGKCMNDTVPQGLINDTSGWDFDFLVHNLDYRDSIKYNITVVDTEFIMPYFTPLSTTRWQTVKISDQRYILQSRDSLTVDTLWLRARDWAPHAVVFPRGMGSWVTRLQGMPRNKYADNAPLLSLTVPRDNDGYQYGSVNMGDYMADHWEETTFSITDSTDTSIKYFYPFIRPDERGMFDPPRNLADLDSFATGRDIRGDGLTNWEEYRGFYVTGTQDTFPLLQNRHERLDPRHKNVFVALSPRLEQDIVDVMPAWFNLIYKPNFDTTDSNQFIETRFVDLELDTSDRYRGRAGRHINENR